MTEATLARSVPARLRCLSKLLHRALRRCSTLGSTKARRFGDGFVDGKELTDVMTLEGPMAPARAIAIVASARGRLEEAHRNGIVHATSPRTFGFSANSPTGQIIWKVLDFGIAKQFGDENGQH